MMKTTLVTHMMKTTRDLTRHTCTLHSNNDTYTVASIPQRA